MDSLNISWRGQSGSGKKKELHKALESVATYRNIPFSIQIKQFRSTQHKISESGQISTTADEETSDNSSEKDCFPYEHSLVHIGFDIARMSMQDKIYLKPILHRWGTGSQVLTGSKGHSSRIIVFYHAHLFSTESCYLLHSLLEESYGNVSIWITSELPVPIRLSDYFIEVPVSFKPSVIFEKSALTWHIIFRNKMTQWTDKAFPQLSETNEIRAFLYELLMRNLRWIDCIHILFDVILIHPIKDESKRNKVLSILAVQEATAAGQTIPSYRIPLLWEALFIDIREALSSHLIDNGSSNSKNISDRSEISISTTPPSVEKRKTNTGGRRATKKGST